MAWVLSSAIPHVATSVGDELAFQKRKRARSAALRRLLRGFERFRGAVDFGWGWRPPLDDDVDCFASWLSGEAFRLTPSEFSDVF